MLEIGHDWSFVLCFHRNIMGYQWISDLKWILGNTAKRCEESKYQEWEMMVSLELDFTNGDSWIQWYHLCFMIAEWSAWLGFDGDIMENTLTWWTLFLTSINGHVVSQTKTAQLNGYNGGWQIEIKRGFDDFRTSQKQPIISRTFGNFFNQHPGAGFGFWTPPCRWLPLVAPQQGWKLPASWGPLANNWSLGTSLWWIYININTLSHSWWNPIYTYNYITLQYITLHIISCINSCAVPAW